MGLYSQQVERERQNEFVELVDEMEAVFRSLYSMGKYIDTEHSDQDKAAWPHYQNALNRAEAALRKAGRRP
jgi:hypothetical protein